MDLVRALFFKIALQDSSIRIMAAMKSLGSLLALDTPFSSELASERFESRARTLVKHITIRMLALVREKKERKKERKQNGI